MIEYNEKGGKNGCRGNDVLELATSNSAKDCAYLPNLSYSRILDVFIGKYMSTAPLEMEYNL